MRFVVPVKWSGNLGVQSGTGEIVQWVRSDRTKTGDTTVNDTLTVCGTTVPDYRSQKAFGNELFGVRFPDSLFDSEVIPTASVTTHVSAFATGGTYTSDQVAIQIGVKMANPLTDAWPKKQSDVVSVDSDKDSKKGITVQAASGDKYALPPVNMFRTKRATQFYLGVRNVAASTGQINTCERFTGTATIPLIGGKLALNSHLLGCLKTDGNDCSDGETDLIDKFQPDYQLNGPASVVMVKMDPKSTCAAVRTAQY